MTDVWGGDIVLLDGQLIKGRLHVSMLDTLLTLPRYRLFFAQRRVFTNHKRGISTISLDCRHRQNPPIPSHRTQL